MQALGFRGRGSRVQVESFQFGVRGVGFKAGDGQSPAGR